MINDLPTVQITKPSNEPLHSNVATQDVNNSHTFQHSMSSSIKFQVEEPPAATRDEVEDARFKMREKYILD